jgi:hypothetical protein
MPLARLVRCGLSSMMRRDQRPREAVHANTAELTVDRDRRRSNHEGIVCPGSLSDIDRSTAANDLRPSVSFSALKNPQRIPANTPPVFLGLRPRIWPHLLRLVTNGNVGQAPTVLDLSRAISIILLVALLSGCGEPVFENAGSPNSLLEDREACAMEMEKSPAAIAYHQNPTAHPEYVSQVFTDMNQCIERKGWKQVRSQQEQEQVREAITSELAQTGQPASISDSKTTEAFVRAVEDRLARPSSSAQSATKKD